MSAPVFIVNTGIITAIGSHRDACLQSLKAGRHGIGKAQHLNSFWAESIPLAEIGLPNTALADTCRMPRHLPRTALLSCIAAQEAWAPFSKENLPFPVSFFSANTVGGMDKTESFYGGLRQNPQHGTPADFIYHECGAITRLVAHRLGFEGLATTISTACSSSANSIMLAGQAIRAGLIDVAVAGGADSLCRFTLNGFNTLGILDRQLCQPFDAGRRGLNLGEGAGYLLLMSEKALLTSGAIPMAMLRGWGNANDAYHQTASSPEGAGNTLAIQAALGIASLKPEDISYINLHGTGTENNDLAEGRAIEMIFGEKVPPSSSTKSFTGHTLGASGGIEAVFAVLSITEGFVPPNLRWQQQMPEHQFSPVTQMRHQEIKHVLSNSFGFGGACSSLILSAC